MNLGKKKIIAICVGVFVLGIAIGALTLLGFSNFNEGSKTTENSTEQVQEATQEESKDQSSAKDQENTKTSENSKKSDESTKKEDSKSNDEEVILLEEDKINHRIILSFNGEKLSKIDLEISTVYGKSLESIKKDYETQGYVTLKYEKDKFLKMESSQKVVDKMNKLGSKEAIRACFVDV